MTQLIIKISICCPEKIAKALNTTVYLTDSYVSRQKGAIENTNKLTGQYIPKRN